MKTTVFVVVMIILFVAVNIIYFSPGDFTFVDANPKPTLIPLSDQKANSNLKIDDEKVGTGQEAKVGNTVTVNYRGTLTDGKEFDSSYKRNEAFTFKLGGGEVIKGWDQGVVGMKVGGKRKLTVPSELGYGPNGAPPSIPGNATLVFEIELMKVQ